MYVDVTDETFNDEVAIRSETATVIVDLWAPWCGPCRTLGPIIERVVDATGGRAVLVKVNVDENPRISQTFRVQSIPAVFAIRDRKIVDQFVGAKPEPQVKLWVEKVAPAQSAADRLVDQGLELGDEGMLWQALDLEPANSRAILSLAGILAESNRGPEALALLARVPESAETAQIAARARLGGSVTAASTAASGDPHEATVAELDELLGRAKGDEEARQRFVDLLAVMGDDERVPALRRKLAAQLF